MILRKRFNSLHFNFQLMILLTVLNVMDYVLTRFLINAGLAEEWNPWLKELIELTGTVDVIILVKLVTVGFCWWIILRTYKVSPETITGKPMMWMLIVSNLIYGFVVSYSIWGTLISIT